MKLFFLSCLIITTGTAYCQNRENNIVPIQRSTTYPLSSSLSINGSSRKIVAIELPENTNVWLYQVTAEKTGTGKGLTLLTQASNAVVPGSGIAVGIAATLLAPEGDVPCNVYLLNSENKDKFLKGSSFNFFGGSSLSIKHTTVEVRDKIYGTWYLGIDNPNNVKINVTLEAVAYVINSGKKYASVAQIRADWQGQNALSVVDIIKKKVDSYMIFDKDKLMGSDSAIAAFKECVVANIIDHHSYAEFIGFQSFQRDLAIQNGYKSCAPSYYYSLTEDEKKAEKIGSLGWDYYKKGDVSKCLEFTKRSIEIAPFLFTKANLALCYLVNGDELNALSAYLEFTEFLEKSKEPVSTKRYALQGALKDIDEAKKKYVNLKGSDEAINLIVQYKTKY